MFRFGFARVGFSAPRHFAPSLTGLRGKNGDRHPTLKGGASLRCAYGAGTLLMRLLNMYENVWGAEWE